MSRITKDAIAKSLKEIMARKPLTRITIAEITDNCGLNRMTFYYHFKDIYDLIKWICSDDTEKALNGQKNYETWQKGVINLCYTLINNRIFVEGVYHSVQREYIENYLYDLVYDLLFTVIKELSEGFEITEKNKRYIADFYKYAFVGVLLEWIKNGMKEKPEEIVGLVNTITNGQLILAIKNMVK